MVSAYLFLDMDEDEDEYENGAVESGTETSDGSTYYSQGGDW